MKQEQFDPALAAKLAAVRRAPRDLRARDELAKAYMAARRYDDALANFRYAVQIDPNNPIAVSNLGTALNILGKYDEAAAQMRRALELVPGEPTICANLGAALHGAGRADEAIEVLAEVLERHPDAAPLRALLASSLERVNRVDEAGSEVARTLEIEPANREALLTKARLEGRRGDTAESIETYRGLLRPGAPNDAVFRSAIGELGVALDRDGQFEEAFAAFTRSNEIQMSSRLTSDINRDVIPAIIAHNAEWFSQNDVSGWPVTSASETAAPIFVVGFPRSGTTLVEQILAAHPRLTTSDEKPFIHQLVRSRLDGFPGWLDTLRDADIEGLRGEFWHRAEDDFGDELRERRLVDKNPMNIIHLGFIRRVFPDSPIVVVLRDPRDAVLSCFMQRFRLNESTIHLTDLRSAARYYAATMDLWRMFRELPGLNAFTIRYEDLVEDTDGKTRELLAFIGEDWDDRLDRRADIAGDRYILTPSFRDVSQPVYRRSLERWRNYGDQMRDILPLLAPFAREFGYAED